MTNEEYNKKKRECWEEFKRTNLDGEVQWQPVSRYEVFSSAFDRAYALGKQGSEKEEVGEVIYNLFREKVQNNEFLAIPDNPSFIDRYLEWSKVFKWTVNAFGKQEKDAEETVIQGWVCRDTDDLLRLHYAKPNRTDGGYWQGGFKSTYFPKGLFPDLTWNDDPLEVEIIIKRKKK